MSIKNKFASRAALAAFAACLASPSAFAAVVCASPNLSIPNTIDGIYLNMVTGASGTSGITGWDINPYNNNAGLTFYGTASPYGVLATGTAGTTAVARALAAGESISPTPAPAFYNQYQTRGTNFQSAGTRYLGVKFLNESTGAANYGWVEIVSGNGTGTDVGFPATLSRYCYENTGQEIQAGTTPVSLQGFTVD